MPAFRHIEVFAARHHFDYTTDPLSPSASSLAAWFRSNDVRAVLHQPIYISDRADAQWSRHVAANLNLIAPEKSHRIAAMDEVKRALESAEQVPFTAAVISLGLNHSAWDDLAIEHSLTAIEHLKAFASPLGVRLLLENMENEVTTPEHLLYIIKTGHFDSVGVCLDVGHLHLAQPVDGAPRDSSGVSAATSNSSASVSASFISTTTTAPSPAHTHRHEGRAPLARRWHRRSYRTGRRSSALSRHCPPPSPASIEIVSDRDEPAESSPTTG